MGRPSNKNDLLEAADLEFKKLWKLVDGMSEVEQTAPFPFEDRDKNLRDVLMHLHVWHTMMESWHTEGCLEGGSPAVPGIGYTWRTLPDLNQKLWESVQNVGLEESKSLLVNSHQRIVNIIGSHSNDDLFSKGIYKWTKSTTLGAYFVSNTSSHYDWAMKKLKKYLKAYRAAQ